MSNSTPSAPNDVPDPASAGSATGDEQQSSETLLRLAVVEGELRGNEQASPLRWSVTLGPNGAIALEFEPVRVSRETAWLLGAGAAQGKFLPRLSIRGVTPDGITVESDHVYLLSHGTTSDVAGSFITLSGDATRLRLLYHPLPATCRNVDVYYFTVGMLAFRHPAADTSLGRITLSGPTKINDPEHVNGHVHIQAPADDQPLDPWLAGCDDLTKRVLDMVSLAEGGLIRWSVRRIESEAGLLVIDCEGKRETGPTWDGIFHHLHLQPALDLAINRYTEDLCHRTGLAIALEWFVHHSDYAELQLISAMTALEHLVAVFVQRQGVPKIMDVASFNHLLQQINTPWQAALEAAPNAMDKAMIGRVKDKLAHINEGSFRDKLEAMLAAYKVPLLGLELVRISKAVAARNRVVHQGLYQSKDERAHIQDHVAVLRELLKRLFLTLLEYQGQYFSLLNGPAWVQFPPMEPATSAADGG